MNRNNWTSERTGGRWRPAILALLCALLAPLQGAAQTLSYDGNRWYEVEVVVFTNAPLGPYQERAVPGKTELSYPNRLLDLTPLSASYRAEFPGPDPTPALANVGGAPGVFPAPADVVPPEPDAGPAPLPRSSQPFRLLDPARDPFLVLPARLRRLNDAVRRLTGSADHRLLYHAAWRQPGLSRAQASAVFVRGGDRFGEHEELEGSVLLTDFGNGVNVDLNLWLSRFRAAGPREFGAPLWNLPAQPFAPPAPGRGAVPPPSGLPRAAFNAAPRYLVQDLARLRQNRNVALDTLHYFDNPALGAIVQVRPYLLPLPAAIE